MKLYARSLGLYDTLKSKNSYYKVIRRSRRMTKISQRLNVSIIIVFIYYNMKI